MGRERDVCWTETFPWEVSEVSERVDWEPSLQTFSLSVWVGRSWEMELCIVSFGAAAWCESHFCFPFSHLWGNEELCVSSGEEWRATNALCSRACILPCWEAQFCFWFLYLFFFFFFFSSFLQFLLLLFYLSFILLIPPAVVFWIKHRERMSMYGCFAYIFKSFWGYVWLCLSKYNAL